MPHKALPRLIFRRSVCIATVIVAFASGSGSFGADPKNATEALALQKRSGRQQRVDIARKVMKFDPQGNQSNTPLIFAEAAKVPMQQAIQSQAAAEQADGPEAREHRTMALEYWKVTAYFNQLAVQTFILQQSHGDFRTTIGKVNSEYGEDFARNWGVSLTK